MAPAAVPIDLDDIEEYAGNNVDAFDYEVIDDNNELDIHDLSIDDDDEPQSRPSQDTSLPDFVELESAELPWGGKIKRGDTVELKDQDKHPGLLVSGDFFRVNEIVENLKTGEVKLRGQLFRRNAYHRPQFGFDESRNDDGKRGDLNEVFMLVHVRPGEPQSPDLRKYKEIGLKDVIRKRKLIITNRPFPLLSFRDMEGPLPAANINKAEAKKYLFHHGLLVCRWIYICYLSGTRTCHGAEIRTPYKRECDEIPHSHRVINKTSAECQRGDQSKHPKSRNARSNSIEIINNASPPKLQLPRKCERYTCADIFCGAGLASQGAIQAGLTVSFAVEKFEKPATAYAKNFPQVTLLPMDAADFVEHADRRNFQVHICHFSCPCQYWSSAHTNEGQHDLDNIRCTYMPGPTAAKLKPPILTFEQTYGFCMQDKHKYFFREFINSILRVGYNVRWRVQDLVEYGVPSRRRRLLIIAARKGIPLPPFPRPTHGAPGTGLKPFVTIYDAEEPLRRQRGRDVWHNPDDKLARNKSPFNPRHSLVKGVLTTDGGANYNHHWSGNRGLTVREAAYYQCCPPGFRFEGTHRDAMKQVGNGYPCSAAEQHFLTCAQTLEAFYNGLIDEEEDIQDLWETLDAKGIQIPYHPQPTNLFDNTRHGNSGTQFRYLSRLIQTPFVPSTHRTFRRTIDLRRSPHKRTLAPQDLISISDDEDDELEIISELPRRPKKRSRTRGLGREEGEGSFWGEFGGKTITLDD